MSDPLYVIRAREWLALQEARLALLQREKRKVTDAHLVAVRAARIHMQAAEQVAKADQRLKQGEPPHDSY